MPNSPAPPDTGQVRAPDTLCSEEERADFLKQAQARLDDAEAQVKSWEAYQSQLAAVTITGGDAQADADLARRRSEAASSVQLAHDLVRTAQAEMEKLSVATVSQCIDPCLIGKWEAVSVKHSVPAVNPDTAGVGFQVSFKSDGTQTVDYANMTPFIFVDGHGSPTDKWIYAGTASGRISTKDRVARLETVEKSDAKMIFDFEILGHSQQGMPIDLKVGPAGLGSTADDNTYACSEDSLEYRGSMNKQRQADLSFKLVRVGSLTVRFTDRDFKPLTEALVAVLRPAGLGTGEVWVEVEAEGDDPGFDDSTIDKVSVKVTSDVDEVGDTVDCVETAAASRLFRSQRPVLLRPDFAEVRP